MNWRVEVFMNGRNLVSIEPRCLSGKDGFTPEEEEAIRQAGENLLAFIGPRKDSKTEPA